ncbi:hypothetical protein [Caballeronia sp. Lep1P3]|nr:hypothetical protein [Caballeronia sp. Lep1P3]
MFENISLDQFSALDDFLSTTPVWKPFAQAQAPLHEDERTRHACDETPA